MYIANDEEADTRKLLVHVARHVHTKIVLKTMHTDIL